MGEKSVQDYEATFAVPFKNGKNVLTAVDEKGHADFVKVDFNMIPYRLNASSSVIDEIAVNVGAEVSFFDPKSKIMWMPDCEYTPNSWGYTGGAPYTVNQRQLKTGIDDNILGTDVDPLFQTFMEGLETYRFDVPDGKYELTLCFQEHISADGGNNMYNLANREDEADKSPHLREFMVSINNKNVINTLNLQRDYGSLRAVVYDFTINAENGEGIEVDFKPINGKATLSGIRIKNLR